MKYKVSSSYKFNIYLKKLNQVKDMFDVQNICEFRKSIIFFGFFKMYS